MPKIRKNYGAVRAESIRTYVRTDGRTDGREQIYSPSQILWVGPKTIYNALIQPHIDYGILSWGTAAETNLNKISSLQRKAIRILTFKKKEEDSAPLFKQENLLPLEKCIILQNCKFIWKFVNKQQPASINTLFIKHQIYFATRHVNELKLNLSFKRTELGTSFLFYSGIKHWNNLPFNVKSSKSTFSFSLKRNLKLFLQGLVS